MPTQINLKQLYDRAAADDNLFEAVVQGRANVNDALAPYDLRLSDDDASALQEGLARIAPTALDFDKFPSALGGWGPWRAKKIKLL